MHGLELDTQDEECVIDDAALCWSKYQLQFELTLKSRS